MVSRTSSISSFSFLNCKIDQFYFPFSPPITHIYPSFLWEKSYLPLGKKVYPQRPYFFLPKAPPLDCFPTQKQSREALFPPPPKMSPTFPSTGPPPLVTLSLPGYSKYLFLPFSLFPPHSVLFFSSTGLRRTFYPLRTLLPCNVCSSFSEL